MAETITIADVLVLVDNSVLDGQIKPFSIVYVKSDGSIGRISRAVKSYKPADAGFPPERSHFRINVKQKEVLLLQNLEATAQGDKYRAIKFRKVVFFNEMRVKH
jgi:hypothetical protein